MSDLSSNDLKAFLKPPRKEKRGGGAGGPCTSIGCRRNATKRTELCVRCHRQVINGTRIGRVPTDGRARLEAATNVVEDLDKAVSLAKGTQAVREKALEELCALFRLPYRLHNIPGRKEASLTSFIDDDRTAEAKIRALQTKRWLVAMSRITFRFQVAKIEDIEYATEVTLSLKTNTRSDGARGYQDPLGVFIPYRELREFFQGHFINGRPIFARLYKDTDAHQLDINDRKGKKKPTGGAPPESKPPGA